MDTTKYNSKGVLSDDYILTYFRSEDYYECNQRGEKFLTGAELAEHGKIILHGGFMSAGGGSTVSK